MLSKGRKSLHRSIRKTVEGICLSLIHIYSTDLGFALAAVALNHHHALSFVGGNQACLLYTSFPPEGSAQLHPDGAVDDLEHGAVPVVPAGDRKI